MQCVMLCYIIKTGNAWGTKTHLCAGKCHQYYKCDNGLFRNEAMFRVHLLKEGKQNLCSRQESLHIVTDVIRNCNPI